MLAKKSPHFFTYGNNPIAKLPDYLESMLKKMSNVPGAGATQTNGKAPASTTDTSTSSDESKNGAASAATPS